MNSSLLTFPERGPWGSAVWPGNASGHVYRAVVYTALTTLGDKASLDRLYATIEREAPEHDRRNQSWREKLRQTPHPDARVDSEQRGVWKFPA